MTQSVLAVIGCGNIGSRCLQALAKLGRETVVHAVDPSPKALDGARERIAELGAAATASVQYAGDLRQLPRQIDLAFVATCADIRRGVIDALLGHAKVRYLVLEKFLFQRGEDYAAVGGLLERAGVRCWVNLLRRSWPGYEMVRRKFVNTGPVEMQAIGHDYRLASNAIHYLDLYSFVTGAQVQSLDGGGLWPQDGPVRRAGFRELCGVLRGRADSGAGVVLGSYCGSTVPVVVRFSSPDAHCDVHELERRVRFVTPETGYRGQETDFATLGMSDMTETYADILRRGDCVLPGYGETAARHLALMEVFNRHWFGEKWAEAACPVT